MVYKARIVKGEIKARLGSILDRDDGIRVYKQEGGIGVCVYHRVKVWKIEPREAWNQISRPNMASRP
jgi:hypothetical protein